MIEVHTAGEAMAQAERLLARLPGNTDLWRSVAVGPLAAALLGDAAAHDGQADLTRVREAIIGSSGPSGDDTQTGWALVAHRCPAPLLRGAALRADQLRRPVQRDSLLLTVSDALSHR